MKTIDYLKAEKNCKSFGCILEDYDLYKNKINEAILTSILTILLYFVLGFIIGKII